MKTFADCSWCGRSLRVNAGSSTTPVCRACRREARERECQHCGKVYEKRSSERGFYCSQPCANPKKWPSEAERYVAKKRRRRAMLRGAESEPYTMDQIAELTDFNCAICGTYVNMNLTGLDENGPNLDHIVPLSRGGSGLKENIQLAHRRCNLRKGARVEGQDG
jgi:5-methylcytosine-specific restriction endonuclease McrA